MKVRCDRPNGAALKPSDQECLALPAPRVRWLFPDQVDFRDALLGTPEMRPNFPLITE